MKRLPSNIVKVDSICKNPNFKKKLFEIKNKQKYVNQHQSLTYKTRPIHLYYENSRVNVCRIRLHYIWKFVQTEIFYNDSPIVV
jgi:hypothetical protein